MSVVSGRSSLVGKVWAVIARSRVQLGDTAEYNSALRGNWTRQVGAMQVRAVKASGATK